MKTNAYRQWTQWLIFGCLSLWLLGVGCAPIPKPECEQDANCNTGQVCSDGKCVDKEPTSTDECSNADGGNCPGCKQDSDCNNDQKCVSGQCVEAKECTKDDDCKGKAQPFCSSEGKCALECKEDTHCKDKTKPFCSSANLCEWECKQDSDCKDDKACQNNRCILSGPECRKDVDCKGKAREFCSDAGKCEWQCKTNGDCDAWNETCEQNVCKPKPGSCKTDNDCSQGQKCLRLRCVTPCKDPLESTDCPQGETCLFVGLFCAKPCSTHADCADGFLCEQRTRRQFAGSCTRPDECNRVSQCIPWAPETGQGKRGDSCHNKNNACDGTQQLYCANVDNALGKCAQSCRPGKDEDCAKGEVCEIASCYIESFTPQNGCPPLGGACYRKGTKKEGEACTDNPEGTERCAPGLQCDRGQCYKPCDPTKEKENPVCSKDRRCLPYWRSLTGGICFRKGTKKEGERCLSSRFSDLFQEDWYCIERLFCSDYSCVKPCDHNKGKDNNPDCATDQQCLPLKASPTGYICIENGAKENERCSAQVACIKSLTCQSQTRASICSKECNNNDDCRPDQSCLGTTSGTTKYCRYKCDPAKGFVLNPACTGKTYCQSTISDAGQNHCLPLFVSSRLATIPQPASLHKPCGFGSFPLITKGCDFGKGQECIDLDGNLRDKCFQTCDPRKGVLSNATCNGGVCRESPTPEGGICEPLGTAKEGEACSLPKGCDKGLVCYGFKCVKACDPTKTNACAKGSFCWRQRCVKECNPSEGIHPNPACPANTHCFSPTKSTILPVIPNKAFCETNANQPHGVRPEGAACTINSTLPTAHCDNRKGLICDGMTSSPNKHAVCRPVCDPTKGFFNNPSCQKGQVCLTGPVHKYMGPPDLAGGHCAFACQPENGPLADCPKGMICAFNKDSGNSYHTCEPVQPPERGPRELGESCLKAQAQACNGNKQLFCKFTIANTQCKSTQTPTGCAADQECLNRGSAADFCYTGRCTQSCTIGATTNSCKATEECTLDAYSPTGGSCTPKPTKKLGEDCSQVGCSKGLRCVNQVCQNAQPCDSAKDNIGARQCPGNQQCVPSLNVCSPFPAKENGTNVEGDRCALNRRCDGTKDLFCNSNLLSGAKCTKTCDPDTGNGCNANELCQLVQTSPTGAGCFPKGKGIIGDRCGTNADCFGAADLMCHRSSRKCRKRCDAMKACASNEICVKSTTSPDSGCFPKKPPAKEREACNLTEGTTCAQGLICACDPVSSTSCVCIAENAKEGNYCNGLQWRCAKGLTCWGGRCLKECDMSKGTTSNPTCKATESCKKSTKSSLGGMCFPQ